MTAPTSNGDGRGDSSRKDDQHQPIAGDVHGRVKQHGKGMASRTWHDEKHEVIFQILQKNAERSGILSPKGVGFCPKFWFLAQRVLITCRVRKTFTFRHRRSAFDLQTGDVVPPDSPPKRRNVYSRC